MKFIVILGEVSFLIVFTVKRYKKKGSVITLPYRIANLNLDLSDLPSNLSSPCGLY